MSSSRQGRQYLPVLIKATLGQQCLSHTAQLLPDGGQARSVPSSQYSCCLWQHMARSHQTGTQHAPRKLSYRDWFKTPCRMVIDLITLHKFKQDQDTQSVLVSMVTQLPPHTHTQTRTLIGSSKDRIVKSVVPTEAVGMLLCGGGGNKG